MSPEDGSSAKTPVYEPYEMSPPESNETLSDHHQKHKRGKKDVRHIMKDEISFSLLHMQRKQSFGKCSFFWVNRCFFLFWGYESYKFDINWF